MFANPSSIQQVKSTSLVHKATGESWIAEVKDGATRLLTANQNSTAKTAPAASRESTAGRIACALRPASFGPTNERGAMKAD